MGQVEAAEAQCTWRCQPLNLVVILSCGCNLSHNALRWLPAQTEWIMRQSTTTYLVFSMDEGTEFRALL